jgi:uncharacterized membrane protein YccC
MPAAIRAVLTDPALRYGLKFGLAGVLAVFLALVIRLEEPTWALFTVFVLMIAQYVGAIAEKSVFRIIGTVVGALLGYVLTASLQQQPWIFLPLVGLIVAYCTAMFGQSRYPYAFFLCGMTITVVVSNGMGNPDFSWRYALWRIEEVTLGILVAVLVQSLLWPRFARQEFVANVQGAFADLRDCFSASARSIFLGGDPAAAQRAEDFPARITNIRGLLDFGARESQHFRDRLPTYFELTTCLARIAAAIATLSKTLPDGSYYQAQVRGEYSGVHDAIEAALEDLSRPDSTAASRAERRGHLAGALKVLEDRLVALRADPRLFDLPVEDASAFGLHLLAVYEIHEQILRAQDLLDSLPTDMGDFTHGREPEPYLSPVPPPFWIHAGVKSALAVIVALIIDNWLNPPGGAMFVLGAWVLTSLNATSPGGRGDWRAFHYVVYATVVIGAVSLVLLAIRPLLASYAVMNTILFTWLFVWGYASFRIRGVTIPMQLAMLMIVGILGLNGQDPISFEDIVNYFFGLVLALVLAAVIQRLIWPSLPQWELRHRLVELLTLSRCLLERGPGALPLWQKTRIALIPGEAGTRIDRLDSPVLPEGEQERLREYLGILRRVGAELAVSAGRLPPLLPQGEAGAHREKLDALELEMRRHLAAHAAALAAARPPEIDPGVLQAQLSRWKESIATLREWLLRHDWPVIDTIRIVGLSARYAEAGQALLSARESAGRLRLALYMGDYVL